MRRLDRKRPGRKTSNAEWQAPHDPADPAERVLAVEARLHAVLGTDPETAQVKTLIADKGYYKGPSSTG